MNGFSYEDDAFDALIDFVDDLFEEDVEEDILKPFAEWRKELQERHRQHRRVRNLRVTIND